MLELIDSHCHLDTEAFDADRAEMFARAAEAGLSAMIVPGIAIEDMPRVLALASAQPNVYVGVGVHPHECETWTDTTYAQLREWASHPKVVAIGEIGLDYHYDYPRDVQKEVFRQQIRLAREVGKPIIVHDREAHGDTLAILKEELDPTVGGIMHCFSGSLEFARECIKAGMVISFAGSLTFKNAHNLQEAAQHLPLEHLLVETDSPYMAPIPYRGKRNEPAYVVQVAEKIAELQGKTLLEVARQTTENTRRIFRLPA